MSTTLRIALRFLTAKKRAMLMSLAGIVFGVGFFIVTQAQTSGFEQFFIRTILGTDGAVRIEDKIQETMGSIAAAGHDEGKSRFEISVRNEGARKYIEGVENPDLVMNALRQFRNVSGASLIVRGSVVADSSFKNNTAEAFGIKVEDHLAVSDLEHQIVRGSIEEFRATHAGAIVGSVLAQRLAIDVGDTLILRAADQQRRYRVTALFETGVRDIDQVRVFVHLGEARSLLQKPTGASRIQVNLFDKDRAPQDAVLMEQVFQHGVMSWQEREKTWLEVFRALRVSSAITVSTIILISGLGMFNTLAMIVMEKTKEIAILRSMGYTREDISHVFLWLGAIVLAAGSVGGWALGFLVTYGVERLPIRIRGIFSTDHFVVDWSHWHYISATIVATIVVMTAALIPARRAARLEPGDIIRGTAQ